MTLDEQIGRLLREDESRLVHEMVRNFSTYEPFGVGLRKQIHSVGIYLKVWLQAHQVIHLFNNPQIESVHWLEIDESGPPIEFGQLSIRVTELKSIQSIPSDSNVQRLCEQIGVPGLRYWFVPFSHRNVPFGHFLLGFLPQRVPSENVLEKVKGSLSVLQNTLQNLLYNHFPITGFTYLPSFQAKQTTEAAIMFCDIRNSTRMTEVTRMAEERFTELVVCLLKSFLEYASRVISVANIGRIHKFTGDGLLATFGEYITEKPEKKAKAACALSLLTATLLVDGFKKLWSVVQQHGIYREWLGLYNEDLDMRLGVGVNYGRIHFDWFGIAVSQAEQGRSPQGFNEYTAVGDQMNFCQRLCSVANQPLSSLNVLYRSDELKASRLTAPIVASKTVTFHLSDHLAADALVRFRTDFEHKGKGHPMPGFELTTEDIPVQLLGVLQDIHDNRLKSAIEQELQQSVSDRPALKAVTRGFERELDRLLKAKEAV